MRVPSFAPSPSHIRSAWTPPWLAYADRNSAWSQSSCRGSYIGSRLAVTAPISFGRGFSWREKPGPHTAWLLSETVERGRRAIAVPLASGVRQHAHLARSRAALLPAGSIHGDLRYHVGLNITFNAAGMPGRAWSRATEDRSWTRCHSRPSPLSCANGLWRLA